MNVKLILLVALGLGFWACTNNNNQTQDTSSSNFIRLDKEIMSIKTEQELGQFLKDHDFYTRLLFRTTADDTSFVNYYYTVVTHPATQEFYKEVLTEFGNFSELQKEFSDAFSKIKETYPAFKAPKIYTTFTGLENDIYVSDSTVIISIEAFAGKNAKYRPVQPAYILNRYDKPYIVPTVIRLLSQSFIEQSQATSLLNDMLYFGKTLEFSKEILPAVPDSIIMGYPDSTMKATWYSQDLVWAYFIDNSLLYEQKPMVKEIYLGERPFVTEIGPECPGRIGQWLGWRIIQKFRTENPDVSFEELMKMKDPQEIVRKSNYRGLVE